MIMVIFKYLSLKALSALQDHEGGGMMVLQNNYTNVSLRLYIIIHQYITAVASVAHTLSPSQFTHTHTPHTHLHRADQADMS